MPVHTWDSRRPQSPPHDARSLGGTGVPTGAYRTGRPIIESYLDGHKIFVISLEKLLGRLVHNRDVRRLVVRRSRSVAFPEACAGIRHPNSCWPFMPCGDVWSTLVDFDERIENAGTLASEPDRDSIVAAIQELDGVLGRPDLTPTQRLTALTTLVQAQRNLGDHRAAIRTWIRIRPFIRTMEDPVHAVWLQQLAGSSFSDLGRHGLACSIFTTAIDRLERLDASASVRSAVLMEAGKAFKQSGDTIRARLCWEQAITLLRGDSEAAYDYARVESNLGALLLEHPNDEEQARGVKMIEDAMGVKARLGDLVGLSTSYSALGAYYLNRGRFQRGIAFTRLDLHISRAIGNRHAIALSLINLAGIYIRFLQLNPARMLLREARQIGDDLNNKRLVSRIDTLSLAVEAAGRSAGKARKRVSPGANCACGSGNPYQDCCGRADFEPVDGLPEFLGFSEDVRLITHEMQDAGGRPSHLDYVLRVTDLAERRNSWVDMTVHDG